MTYILAEADELRNQGQSLAAAKKYQEIAMSSDDPKIVGACLHMSAVCVNQAGDHAAAEDYFSKAEKHYHDIQDGFNLARVQRDHGNCLLAQGKKEEARSSLEASIKGFEGTEDFGELAMSQSKLAAVLAKEGEASEAESLAYKGIQNANKSNNTFYIATAYKEAGRVYFLNKKYEAMLDCLFSALGALELEKDTHARQHAELYLSLSFAYKELNNTELSESSNKKAEEYLEQLDTESANRIRGYFN